MNVFFTVDIEIWPDGWDRLDERFSGAFRRYLYGAAREQVLAANGVAMDTSYNSCVLGETSGIEKGVKLWQAAQVSEVYEYPVSAFEDWLGHFRPAQLAAACYGELRRALIAAERSGWESFVMVSHGFELLAQTCTRPDPIMVQRFYRLCRFLDHHRDLFPNWGFSELKPRMFPGDSRLIPSNIVRTAPRVLEQALRNYSMKSGLGVELEPFSALVLEVN